MPGDLAARTQGLPSSFCSASSPTSPNCNQRVRPAERINVLLHNNGCTGETNFTKIQNGIGGTLSGMRLIGNDSGGRVLHYDPQRLAAAVGPDRNITETDQTLLYAAPAACGEGQQDIYRFETDGKSLLVTFTCEPTPGSGTGTTQQFELAVQMGGLITIGSGFGQTFNEGAVVPLRRIEGGSISGPESGCSSQHLHGLIFIDGRGPFSDPNPTGCGFGIIIQIPRQQATTSSTTKAQRTQLKN